MKKLAQNKAVPENVPEDAHKMSHLNIGLSDYGYMNLQKLEFSHQSWPCYFHFPKHRLCTVVFAYVLSFSHPFCSSLFVI